MLIKNNLVVSEINFAESGAAWDNHGIIWANDQGVITGIAVADIDKF